MEMSDDIDTNKMNLYFHPASIENYWYSHVGKRTRVGESLSDLKNFDFLRAANTVLEQYCNNIDGYMSLHTHDNRYLKTKPFYNLSFGETYHNAYRTFRRDVADVRSKEDIGTCQRYMVVEMHFVSRKELNLFKIKHRSYIENLFMGV
jgi:hypothetical protein